ncbi:MFS transporter [Trinickia violacea]|uniref:MFS transporter n=1 Tax=Trinickia violacea TaxID=2571746 RepID=A0A4V1EIA0_9BURK|nr:MFS transporter [Trinickia violacea]QCP53040.1 MFS transporter [Trinickia violacea]
MRNDASTSAAADDDRGNGLLGMLSAVSFLIFFQAYMVAPIIPTLASDLHAPVARVALVIPAYLIPYGVGTLIYGVLGDRLGILRVMFFSLAAFSVLAFQTAFSTSVEDMIGWRIVTGLGASGAVPLSIALVGRLYPYERRGRALGWLFGAMAGGMALGSPLGAMLIPLTGWRGLFMAVGTSGLIPLLMLGRYRRHLASAVQPTGASSRGVLQGYLDLLADSRARRTYAYVFLNSMFHSGVFAWLGVFIAQQYHVGPVAIGSALLGYGIPGTVLGPLIGRAADKYGRAALIPVGLAIGSTAVAALLLRMPLVAVPLLAIALSLGYDMTQPLFAGIVTSFGGKRPGQAMGVNVFSLFIGAGVGSLVFGALEWHGFTLAFGVFAIVEVALALFALRVFRKEGRGAMLRRT